MADEKKPTTENIRGPIGVAPAGPPQPYGTVPIEHFSVKWRAIFAGAFVALLTYFILLSLGIAFGGANLQGVIQGEDSARGLGIGAGVWMVLSVLISLFVGSWSAGRVSGLIPVRVGRVEGAVVAALFFGFVFMQAGSAIGTVGRGLGSTVSGIARGIGNLAQNPRVQSIVDRSLGDLNLRSSPEEVVEGIATRLVRGDEDGAVRYLSRQAGITEAEARTRIQSVRQDVERAASEAGVATASALKIVGWTLFGALFFGTLVSILGGGLGASASLREPIGRADRKAGERARAA